MDYDPFKTMLAVTKKSTHEFQAFASGYGVAKISAMDLTDYGYVNIHSMPIRDLKYNPFSNQQILTASQDKSLKITSMEKNTCVIS